jgi:predicted carbohydrate-binding protein with CBM5 and CBM33 domain
MKRSLGCVVVVFVSSSAFSHGFILSPPSRQQLCASRQTAFDCGDIKYEPQSVEGIKGLRTCSGDSRFGILDEPLDWPVAHVNAHTAFTWTLTAPHRTTTWEYFVDGQLHAVFNQGNQVPPASVVHNVYGLPPGRHLLLGVWNIGDTPMAFYSCVDMWVD